MGTLSPKKGVMTHWWSKYLRYNHYTMYIIKIWMKLYHKSWFMHICRNFWKCQFHTFWGTFWNPQSLPGEHKGIFFMSGDTQGIRYLSSLLLTQPSPALYSLLEVILTMTASLTCFPDNIVQHCKDFTEISCFNWKILKSIFHSDFEMWITYSTIINLSVVVFNNF